MEMHDQALKKRWKLFKPKEDYTDTYKPDSKEKKKAVSIAAVIIALLVKSKVLILFIIQSLKLDIVLQLFKLGSLGGTVVTMAVMAWAYAASYGWQFAVGLVGLIFIHEMGHYIAARESGVEVTAPVFIPFLGAFIGMKEKPANAEIEGKIAIAGPLAGTLGTLLAAVGWLMTGDELLKGLIYINLIITLFNLIPFGFLDGGRIASAISGKYWLAGLFIFGALALTSRNPVLMVLLISGSISAWKNRKKDRDADLYYDIDTASRSILSLAYFGTLFVNGIALVVFFAIEQGMPLAEYVNWLK